MTRETNIKIDEHTLTPHQDAAKLSMIAMEKQIGHKSAMQSRMTVVVMKAAMPLIAEAMDEIHGLPEKAQNKGKAEALNSLSVGLGNIIVSAVSTVNGEPSLAQVMKFMQHLTGQALFVTGKQVGGELKLGKHMQVTEITDKPHGRG